MKQSIIAIAALATFFFTTIHVQATHNPQEASIVIADDDRREIRYEELPEEVKTSFEDSQFNNWEVSKVYEVEEESFTIYEITISDGTQSGTITYDKDGNML
jgi:hypothetical protein